MSFTKYETRGAYHWQELANRSPIAYSARLHALYRWFLEEARDCDPELVIDVGCGDAALTHLLSEQTNAHVMGIEPEPRGIELAREALAAAGSRAEVVAGRGEDLPLEDSSASLVVLCEVVEHLERVEPLLEEAARVVSADGALLISTPQWQGPELRAHHLHEFKAHELAQLCKAFFGHVSVKVAEPPWLYSWYMARRPARVAVNLLSLAGLNPFGLRRQATSRRARWRELLAVASAPPKPG